MNERNSPSQNKGPLSRLPQDCLVTILDQLSLNDALAISSTCKDLSASATPFAYRSISLDWTSRPLKRLLQLLRLVFQDPELASCVHHLSLVSAPDAEEWEDTQPEIDWETESESFRDVLDQSMDLVRRAQFADAETWHLPIYGGNIYCFAAILLSQLPNLKSLRLDYSLVWWDGYPGLMIKQAVLFPNGTLSTFKDLQVVDYGGNVPIAESECEDEDVYPDSYPPYNPSQFTGWFCLPSLRVLNIWMRDLDDLQEMKPDLDLSNLETLILPRATISDQDVSFLLSRALKLKNLHLGMAYACRRELVVSDAPMLAQALVSVSPTVQNLSLGVEYYPASLGDHVWGDADDHIKEPFSHILHRFSNLQTAEMPLCVLLGWFVDHDNPAKLGPLLPRSLRELCLRDDLRSLYDFHWDEDEEISLLHRFLVDWRAHTPELQRITMRLWDQNHTEFRKEEEEALRSACADAGLTLDIVVDDLGTGLWSRKIVP
ncbi:hypothetical protein EYZ11_010981 [Aspergillus tanneri]|uniref:F-box domain-containing protein n=1 Tax=Aspergillus tanneri TaxID=1220188 RepID=A0A4S3J4K5_9EURO|nr:uncharacterized protein ATNIH1004_009351 [Aspergillus tanneri]KAA8645134.1 hypothetical protein ATNIH1004_009351 [Aspergillus tanneri]THC89572.1 hypothetical protein EYZ11_010981 [Aspergillus tanneri]